MRYVLSGLAATALIAATAVAQQAQQRTAPAPRTMPQPRMPIPVAALLPNTQALFDGYVRDNKMPGIVGAFGTGDGPTLFVTAGRLADVPNAAPAGPDSLWRVYSMTKPITAMAAMILIEEGKLGLDDPLSKYFPAFATMRVATSPDTSLASVPARRPITIRMLLTHSSGLGYSISAKGPLLKEYERLGLTPGAVNALVEVKARQTRAPSLTEFANRLATVPLVAQPGTTWHYSVGLDLMGAVIEKASGMPFDAFVQARLLAPLGMTSTYWTVPASEVRRFAANYAYVGDRRVPVDPAVTSVYRQRPSFPYGGAGLVASARDYDRFLHMLADGGQLGGVRVMKPETARLAMSNLLPPGVTFDTVPGTTGGTKTAAKLGFGAGGSVYLEDGPGGFPGKGTYGWGGAAGTIAWVDPVRRFRGTVMVNYFPADRWPVRAETAAALARDAARLGHR